MERRLAIPAETVRRSSETSGRVACVARRVRRGTADARMALALCRYLANLPARPSGAPRPVVSVRA